MRLGVSRAPLLHGLTDGGEGDADGAAHGVERRSNLGRVKRSSSPVTTHERSRSSLSRRFIAGFSLIASPSSSGGAVCDRQDALPALLHAAVPTVETLEWRWHVSALADGCRTSAATLSDVSRNVAKAGCRCFRTFVTTSRRAARDVLSVTRKRPYVWLSAFKAFVVQRLDVARTCLDPPGATFCDKERTLRPRHIARVAWRSERDVLDVRGRVRMQRAVRWSTGRVRPRALRRTRRVPVLLTITEAAEAAGVARSTLYRAIEAGEITRRSDKKIDTADLLRVYGELRVPGGEGQGGNAAGEPVSDEKIAATPAGLATSPELVTWLRELVDQQQATIARKDAELEQRSVELREAEERAAAERQGLLAQLDRTTALLPAPVEAPAPSRSLWSKVFG